MFVVSQLQVLYTKAEGEEDEENEETEMQNLKQTDNQEQIK